MSEKKVDQPTTYCIQCDADVAVDDNSNKICPHGLQATSPEEYEQQMTG